MRRRLLDALRRFHLTLVQRRRSVFCAGGNMNKPESVDNLYDHRNADAPYNR
jgi:hypothetical protein